MKLARASHSVPLPEGSLAPAVRVLTSCCRSNSKAALAAKDAAEASTAAAGAFAEAVTAQAQDALATAGKAAAEAFAA